MGLLQGACPDNPRVPEYCIGPHQRPCPAAALGSPPQVLPHPAAGAHRDSQPLWPWQPCLHRQSPMDTQVTQNTGAAPASPPDLLSTDSASSFRALQSDCHLQEALGLSLHAQPIWSPAYENPPGRPCQLPRAWPRSAPSSLGSRPGSDACDQGILGDGHLPDRAAR